MCFSCVFYLLRISYQRIEVKKREWFNLRQGKRNWATFQQSLGCLVVELVLLVSSWMFLGASHAKSSKYLKISWKLSIRKVLDMFWFYLCWFARCISKKQQTPTKKSADYGKKSVDWLCFDISISYPTKNKGIRKTLWLDLRQKITAVLASGRGNGHKKNWSMDTPWKMVGLENKPFLLGPGSFSGAVLLS